MQAKSKDDAVAEAAAIAAPEPSSSGLQGNVTRTASASCDEDDENEDIPLSRLAAIESTKRTVPMNSCTFGRSSGACREALPSVSSPRPQVIQPENPPEVIHSDDESVPTQNQHRKQARFMLTPVSRRVRRRTMDLSPSPKTLAEHQNLSSGIISVDTHGSTAFLLRQQQVMSMERFVSSRSCPKKKMFAKARVVKKARAQCSTVDEAGHASLQSSSRDFSESSECIAKGDHLGKPSNDTQVCTCVDLLNAWKTALCKSEAAPCPQCLACAGDNALCCHVRPGYSVAFQVIEFALEFAIALQDAFTIEVAEAYLQHLMPHIHNLFMDFVSLCQARVTEYEALLERLTHGSDAPFVLDYIFQHASEAAKADLKELEAAVDRGVWLSEDLYKLKVDFERDDQLAALRIKISAARKRVPVIGSQTVQIKVPEAKTDEHMQANNPLPSPEHLAACMLALEVPELSEGHQVYVAGRALILDLVLLLAKPENQSPGSSIRDGVAEFKCSSPVDAPPMNLRLALATALGQVLASSALDRETRGLPGLEGRFSQLRKETEAALAIARDAGNAHEEVTGRLEGGTGKYEDLRNLLSRVKDERVCSEAMRDMREKIQREAEEEIAQLKPRLIDAEKKLQRCQKLISAWEAVAKAQRRSELATDEKQKRTAEILRRMKDEQRADASRREYEDETAELQIDDDPVTLAEHRSISEASGAACSKKKAQDSTTGACQKMKDQREADHNEHALRPGESTHIEERSSEKGSLAEIAVGEGSSAGSTVGEGTAPWKPLVAEPGTVAEAGTMPIEDARSSAIAAAHATKEIEGRVETEIAAAEDEVEAKITAKIVEHLVQTEMAKEEADVEAKARSATTSARRDHHLQIATSEETEPKAPIAAAVAGPKRKGKLPGSKKGATQKQLDALAGGRWRARPSGIAAARPPEQEQKTQSRFAAARSSRSAAKSSIPVTTPVVSQASASDCGEWVCLACMHGFSLRSPRRVHSRILGKCRLADQKANVLAPFGSPRRKTKVSP